MNGPTSTESGAAPQSGAVLDVPGFAPLAVPSGLVILGAEDAPVCADGRCA
ncbi:hypothetical protein JOL79_20450 [Microbispora sp. RL4-1S]|uniref:Uncharacterized protein n=1 Tax=Microbispora oryzae TaxID=2806554 RepID=A0A941ARJ2_9ACTN|nr:hypothetical protein [Microbispora oryzae]MBP2706184.1 hypothetical protein [Microbispora oryzae]